MVYIDKSTQPNKHKCLGSLLQKFHGKLDAETLINIIGLEGSGDLHAAVYDFKANAIYVGVAQNGTWPAQQPVLSAYKRQFIRLDMNKLFNEKV